MLLHEGCTLMGIAMRLSLDVEGEAEEQRQEKKSAHKHKCNGPSVLRLTVQGFLAEPKTRW